MSDAMKCDNCGCYGDVSGNFWSGLRSMPPSWIRVQILTSDDRGEVNSDHDAGGTFCRYECAAAFVLGKRK